jgi:hypothetical protein
MFHRRRVIHFATLAIAIAAVFPAVFFTLRLTRPRSYASVSPDRSEHLRGVAEPITMTYAISWSDGGSKGLAFVDSEGREFSVCLMNDLDGDRRLRFGSIVPGKGHAVPIGGAEERAFLGLLERWAMQSPEARAWESRLAQWRNSDRRSSLSTGDETDEQRGIAFGVSIKDRLSRRN